MKMEVIAKLAGVSKSAVSFALSGKPGISNETRERVLEIARDFQEALNTKIRVDTRFVERHSSHK